MKPVDIVVVGAGPAGMAASKEVMKSGADLVVLDEQAGPGGQIYRSILETGTTRADFLGDDYRAGRPLAEQFAAGKAGYRPGATVWRVDPDGTLAYSVAGRASRIRARHIILATGALERAVPLPGWTLPGVMSAGAAQILLKSASIAAAGAVLVGSGPLLYLVACQLIGAGYPPKALVETQTLKNHGAALKHWTGAVTGWRAVAKGLGLLRAIRKAGVPRFTAANDIRIAGDGQVGAVEFKSAGRSRQIPCSTVLLHQGVVPNTQISRALRLDHAWDAAQHCFRPVVDPWGTSSSSLISIAGDGAGIGGAKVAELSGRLAALNALMHIGLLDEAGREAAAAPVRAERDRQLAVRPFLDALYAPPEEILAPADATLVCRCEEVTAGDIRRFAGIGCVGPNQTKAFGRCGMGPCQGRLCGLPVTEILARENSLSHDEVGAYRIRAPLKPVSLGEIASLDEG